MFTNNDDDNNSKHSYCIYYMLHYSCIDLNKPYTNLIRGHIIIAILQLRNWKKEGRTSRKWHSLDLKPGNLALESMVLFLYILIILILP